MLAALALPTLARADLPPKIPVRDLFANPAISSPRLSPDGTLLAFLASQGDTQIVATRALAGGPTTGHGKLASPETRFSWLTWAKPDVLWVSASIELKPRSYVRGRLSRVLSVSLPSGEVEGLDWAPYVVHWLPDDPERVLVDWDGGVAPIRAADGKRSGKRAVGAQRRIWEWHADRAAVVRAGEAFTSGAYKLFVRSNAETSFELALSWRHADGVGPLFLGFHDDPEKFYVASPHVGRRAVFTFDRTSGALELVQADPVHDVESLIEDPETERALGVAWIADAPEERWFDPAEQSDRDNLRKALAPKCGEHCSIAEVSRDRGRKLSVLEASSPTFPRAVG
jgi:hypothetical protein